MTIIKNQLEQDLIKAASEGDLAGVKKALDAGADIHTDKDFPLERAADNGHFEVVKFLLDAGADIHGDRDFPLLWAVYNNHFEIAQYLVERGADISTLEYLPFRKACEFGFLKTVRYLAECGSDLHAKGDDAIIAAYKNKHQDVVDYIIDHGQWQLCGDNRQTALRRLASKDETVKLVQYIQEKLDEKARTEKRRQDEKAFAERQLNEERVAVLKVMTKPFQVRKKR